MTFKPASISRYSNFGNNENCNMTLLVYYVSNALHFQKQKLYQKPNNKKFLSICFCFVFFIFILFFSQTAAYCGMILVPERRNRRHTIFFWMGSLISIGHETMRLFQNIAIQKGPVEVCNFENFCKTGKKNVKTKFTQ